MSMVKGWFSDEEETTAEQKQKIEEANRNIEMHLQNIVRLTKQLAELEYNFKLQGQLPYEQWRQLSLDLEKAEAEYLRKRMFANNLFEYRKTGWEPYGDTPAEKKADEFATQARLKQEAIDAFQKMSDLQSKLDQVRDRVEGIINKAITDIKNLEVSYMNFSDSLAYGYKNGAFGNWVDDAKLARAEQVIKAATERITKLKDELSGPIGPATRNENYAEQLNATKAIYSAQQNIFQLRMKALEAERAAALKTIQNMQKLLSEASKFRSDAISAVSADSLQAIRLQDRREPTQDILNEYVKKISGQQAQVKDIETKMLTEQEKARTTLGTIKDNIVSLYKEVTRRQTGFDGKIEINLVNPF